MNPKKKKTKTITVKVAYNDLLELAKCHAVLEALRVRLHDTVNSRNLTSRIMHRMDLTHLKGDEVIAKILPNYPLYVDDTDATWFVINMRKLTPHNEIQVTLKGNTTE